VASAARGFAVERMRSDDWERVRRVRLRALTDTPDAFGSTLATEFARPPEGWRARLADLASATFVATEDREDVGLIVGSRYEGSPGTAGLFAMWVQPERRGRGIAQALVRAVIAWARAAGYARLLLDVGDWNAAAIRLYERMGFTPTGVTGFLSPERAHVLEHQRALDL
jgi:GNAT superfamily N-acetyltransferase